MALVKGLDSLSKRTNLVWRTFVYNKSWQINPDSLELGPMQSFTDSPGCFSWALCFPPFPHPFHAENAKKGDFEVSQVPIEKTPCFGTHNPKRDKIFLRAIVSSGLNGVPSALKAEREARGWTLRVLLFSLPPLQYGLVS